MEIAKISLDRKLARQTLDGANSTAKISLQGQNLECKVLLSANL